VPGFADGIRLKPWQVQGRFWMKDREEDKKRGGILADDVSLDIVCSTPAHDAISVDGSW
jgi:SNF2 family DNA or RNA helicase